MGERREAKGDQKFVLTVFDIRKSYELQPSLTLEILGVGKCSQRTGDFFEKSFLHLRLVLRGIKKLENMQVTEFLGDYNHYFLFTFSTYFAMFRNFVGAFCLTLIMMPGICSSKFAGQVVVAQGYTC